MAAVTLKVETSKLLSTADQFAESANKVNNTINRMLQLVNGIGTQWMGQGAETYKHKFAKHDQDRRDIYGLITEHVNDLNQIAKNIQTTEHNVVSNARSLRSDVVH